MKEKKSFFKKIALCCIMAFFALSVCACSPVIMSTKQSSKGVVTSAIGVDVKTLTPTQKQKTYNLVNEFQKQMWRQYEKNLIELFSQEYDFSAPEFKSEKDKVTKIVSEHIEFLCYNFEFFPKNFSTQMEEIVLKVDFSSIFAYLSFICPDALTYNAENEKVTIDTNFYSSLVDIASPSVSLEKDEKTFVYSYIQTCMPFSYNLKEPVLFEDILISGKTYLQGTKLLNVFASELKLNKSEAEFIYNFITPYSRVHSSADKISLNSNGDYVHTWKFKDISTLVKFWRTNANYFWWYMLALGIGVLTLVISLSVLFILRHNKKKKAMNTLKMIDNLVVKNEKDSYIETFKQKPKKTKLKDTKTTQNDEKQKIKPEKQTENINSKKNKTSKKEIKVDEKSLVKKKNDPIIKSEKKVVANRQKSVINNPNTIPKKHKTKQQAVIKNKKTTVKSIKIKDTKSKK